MENNLSMPEKKNITFKNIICEESLCFDNQSRRIADFVDFQGNDVFMEKKKKRAIKKNISHGEKIIS